MKYFPIVLKSLIVLSTLLTAWAYFVIAAFYYEPTGLFGVSNSIHEQTVSRIIIASNIVMIIASFLIFRKNNLRYLIIMLAAQLITFISLITIGNVNIQIILFNLIYAALIIVFYFKSEQLEKKRSQPEATKTLPKETFPMNRPG